MKFIRAVMALSFVLLFASVFGKAAYADDVKYLPQKSNVDVSKSWSIKFNSELLSGSVNLNNIKVLDGSNNPQDISVALQEDKKTVLVSPSTKYKYSTAYTLVITKDVRTQTGIALSKTTMMQFTTMPDPNPDTNKQYTVCIDAGHGGDDSTSITGPSGIKEKDIDLAVALKLGDMLKANGVNVIYTRTSDVYMDNASRVNISNAAKADYYVSIHCNTAANATAEGALIIYEDGSGNAQTLAQAIQNTGITERSIQTSSNYAIPDINNNNAAVVKVCLGFLNNPDEEKELASGDYQDKCAQAISNALIQCRNVSDDNSIISVKSPIKTINVGDSITLPTSIQAQYEDNSTKDVPVTWNTSSVNNSSAGTYTCTGNVAGYSKPVYATVIVLSSGKPTVCLDAGHGMGDDVGATGVNKIQEDDITLAVTLKAGKILESNGVNVVYTRTSDMRNVPMSVDDSLQRRCDISNSAKANYFVCIHCNVAVADAHGTETYYYYNKENTAEWQLAEAVQNSLVSTLKSTDRGVKSAGWYVIVPDNINCPSILTELGFISNQDEGTKLSSSSYQEQCAEAIAKAVLSRLGK